jgi:hypothetical protein
LLLAQVLENLPDRLMLRGIEMDVCRTGFTLSAAVIAAIPVFVREIGGRNLGARGDNPSISVRKLLQNRHFSPGNSIIWRDFPGFAP